jgi:myo-inositol catabolism protein IolC
MSLGYDGTLFILAFDHRGSFRSKMFGITGDPTSDEHARLEDAKRLVWEGFKAALEAGAPAGEAGILVDEEMGAAVAREAKEMGVLLAMPVEKSGQPDFDFEYGDDFAAHIEAFDPSFSKVLVRWNPDDSAATKAEQGEGIDTVADCELIAGLTRSGGRDGVTSVVLGRGADDAKVDHWLRMGAPVDGYTGFAIGRSIWWAGVEGWKDGTMERDAAVASISDNFTRFIEVYRSATA